MSEYYYYTYPISYLRLVSFGFVSPCLLIVLPAEREELLLLEFGAEVAESWQIKRHLAQCNNNNNNKDDDENENEKTSAEPLQIIRGILLVDNLCEFCDLVSMRLSMCLRLCECALCLIHKWTQVHTTDTVAPAGLLHFLHKITPLDRGIIISQLAQ